MAGLVLANSAQWISHAVIIFVLLWRKTGGLRGLDVWRTIKRTLAACAVMAGVMQAIVLLLGPRLGTEGLIANGALMLVTGSGAACSRSSLWPCSCAWARYRPSSVRSCDDGASSLSPLVDRALCPVAASATKRRQCPLVDRALCPVAPAVTKRRPPGTMPGRQAPSMSHTEDPGLCVFAATGQGRRPGLRARSRRSQRTHTNPCTAVAAQGFVFE